MKPKLKTDKQIVDELLMILNVSLRSNEAEVREYRDRNRPERIAWCQGKAEMANALIGHISYLRGDKSSKSRSKTRK